MEDTLKYCSSKCPQQLETKRKTKPHQLNKLMCNFPENISLTVSCGNVQHYDLWQNAEVPGKMNYFVSKYLPCTDLANSGSWGRCAIVGSSGSLKRIPHGQEIDQYDTIIRFNSAPTKGYEHMVGSRTDYRVVNHRWVTGIEGPLPLEIQAEDSRKLVRYRGTGAMHSYHGTMTEHFFSTFRLMDDEFMNQAEVCLRERRYSLRHQLDKHIAQVHKTPTSGFITIIVASYMCSKISAFGFVSEAKDSYNYYGDDSQFGAVKLASHNFELETAILEYWDNLSEHFTIVP